MSKFVRRRRLLACSIPTLVVGGLVVLSGVDGDSTSTLYVAFSIFFLVTGLIVGVILPGVLVGQTVHRHAFWAGLSMGIAGWTLSVPGVGLGLLFVELIPKWESGGQGVGILVGMFWFGGMLASPVTGLASLLASRRHTPPVANGEGDQPSGQLLEANGPCDVWGSSTMARFEHADVAGVHVIRPIGDFSDTEEAFALLDQLSDNVGPSEGFLVINWERTKDLKAPALGAILRTVERFRSQGGCVRHCCVTGRILRIFELTRLTQMFELFDTEFEAVESFGHRERKTEP